MWRPFGPTTSSTSASISSCRTPSPTPTDSAKSPSLAAPASSPSASSTDWGSPSMLSWLAATDAADTVLMRLVLLSSWTWFRTHHGPNGTGRGGRTAAIKFYELRDNLAWTAAGLCGLVLATTSARRLSCSVRLPSAHKLTSVGSAHCRDVIPVGLLVAGRGEREAFGRRAHPDDEVLEAAGCAEEEHAAAFRADDVAMRDVARAPAEVSGAGLDHVVADVQGHTAFEDQEALVLAVVDVQRGLGVRGLGDLH